MHSNHEALKYIQG